jgi:hypothetical protein
MRIALMSEENPLSPLLTASSDSNRVILIPPEKRLLLHVASDGFNDRDESAGRGKLVYLHSGTRLTLDVQLQPIN